MIKYIILLIHLIGFSFYQLFFGDVTASQKVPNQLKPGEEVTVEVTISKEDVTGFAKFQETLPTGFSADIIDAKGATFSFKDNIMKFIWMALPADKEFTISYKLKAADDVSGNFSLGGKFSFISDNERKNIDLASSSISIIKPSDAVAENTVAEETNIETPKIETITNPVTENVVETTNENVSSNLSINASRIVEKIGDKYKVTLTINQKNLAGFAKYVDIIPNGFKATTDNPEGGIFSFNENEAKVLWMSIPTKEKIIVSYFIEPTSLSKNGDFNLEGSLSYLENDVTQKYTIPTSSFTYNGQEVAQEVTQVEPKKTIPETTKPTSTEKSNTTNIPPVLTPTPSGEKGVTYKVQVGAAHRTVSKNYFANKFSLADAISIETNEGWIKYVVGKYTVYKDARDKRNDVRNKVERAFVTAYNQGKRITVQEALMISNQKWYL